MARFRFGNCFYIVFELETDLRVRRKKFQFQTFRRGVKINARAIVPERNRDDVRHIVFAQAEPTDKRVRDDLVDQFMIFDFLGVTSHSNLQGESMLWRKRARCVENGADEVDHFGF